MENQLNTETLQGFKTLEGLSSAEIEAFLEKKKEEERLLNKAKQESYEALKEQNIQELFNAAMKVENLLACFKAESFEKLNCMDEMLKEYAKAEKKPRKGKKEPVSYQLLSADQTIRIQFSQQQLGTFDERSKMAESLIIEFVRKRFAEDEESQELILSLLERKNGQFDPRLVQKLYKMENTFADENWKQGLKLLRESYQLTDSKDYITFYHRTSVENKWKLVNLNFSSAVI